MPKKDLKERIKETVKRFKHRKKTEGQVNIEGITKPKKHKPKKHKEEKKPRHSPASVSIGAHGGRYIQEPSGHKKYVGEGGLSGRKKFKKSVFESLEDIVKKIKVDDFIKSFKGGKNNE
jgi:hypothetical protein